MLPQDRCSVLASHSGMPGLVWGLATVDGAAEEQRCNTCCVCLHQGVMKMADVLDTMSPGIQQGDLPRTAKEKELGVRRSSGCWEPHAKRRACRWCGGAR